MLVSTLEKKISSNATHITKKDKVRTNVFKNIYKTISDKILQMKRFNAFRILISLQEKRKFIILFKNLST